MDEARSGWPNSPRQTGAAAVALDDWPRPCVGAARWGRHPGDGRQDARAPIRLPYALAVLQRGPRGTFGRLAQQRAAAPYKLLNRRSATAVVVRPQRQHTGLSFGSRAGQSGAGAPAGDGLSVHLQGNGVPSAKRAHRTGGAMPAGCDLGDGAPGAAVTAPRADGGLSLRSARPASQLATGQKRTAQPAQAPTGRTRPRFRPHASYTSFVRSQCL